jgi:hypothetical protein
MKELSAAKVLYAPVVKGRRHLRTRARTQDPGTRGEKSPIKIG